MTTWSHLTAAKKDVDSWWNNIFVPRRPLESSLWWIIFFMYLLFGHQATSVERFFQSKPVCACTWVLGAGYSWLVPKKVPTMNVFSSPSTICWWKMSGLIQNRVHLFFNQKLNQNFAKFRQFYFGMVLLQLLVFRHNKHFGKSIKSNLGSQAFSAHWKKKYEHVENRTMYVWTKSNSQPWNNRTPYKIHT